MAARWGRGCLAGCCPPGAVMRSGSSIRPGPGEPVSAPPGPGAAMSPLDIIRPQEEAPEKAPPLSCDKPLGYYPLCLVRPGRTGTGARRTSHVREVTGPEHTLASSRRRCQECPGPAPLRVEGRSPGRGAGRPETWLVPASLVRGEPGRVGASAPCSPPDDGPEPRGTRVPGAVIRPVGGIRPGAGTGTRGCDESHGRYPPRAPRAADVMLPRLAVG